MIDLTGKVVIPVTEKNSATVQKILFSAGFGWSGHQLVNDACYMKEIYIGYRANHKDLAWSADNSRLDGYRVVQVGELIGDNV